MLESISTSPAKDLDKQKAKKISKQNIKKIIELQKIMAAQQKYSLLVIFQGLDASGKDGATRSVFSGINPSGISVSSFKKPTDKEFAHDFLWRIHKEVPVKGMIKIFNRSHYEDILVPSVEGYLPKKMINQRYKQINHFERLLTQNNTIILKFYLHNSPDNQLQRLNERLEIKEKHFKHNDGDWDTREKRAAYLSVYEKIFKKCSTPKWTVVAADENWYKTYVISSMVLKAMQKLDLKWPDLQTDRM